MSHMGQGQHMLDPAGSPQMHHALSSQSPYSDPETMNRLRQLEIDK